MSTLAKKRFTVEEYFDVEARTEYKNEYYHGEIFAMAGATIAHNDIVANLITAIGERLRGTPCRVMPSDTRIKCRTNLYTYADSLIVCGEREVLKYQKLETLLNPRVVFEVLSESTESYDRGKKFEHYQTIESFEEYVLVAQDRPHIDHFVRQSAGSWRLTMIDGLESKLKLATVGCELPFQVIFEGVTFPPETAAADERWAPPL
jgi:Uma2 family endonuclease